MSKKEKTTEEKENQKTTKNMNLRNNNNGITLIALVITIIVLLILAGVTINLTLGENGIFRTAEQAGRNYTQAQEQELAGLVNFENTINNIINGNNTPIANYERLASKAQAGDYVKYTPANKNFTMKIDGMSVTDNTGTTEYTLAEHGIATGYDTEQTYSTNDYTGLWQVLYNDEEHGLQIISADVVTGDKQLHVGHNDDETKAKYGYNNYINTLNAFCNNYADTRYAISGRCVGTDPINPKDTITQTEILQFEYNGTTDSGCKIEGEGSGWDDYAMEIATSQNSEGIKNIGKAYYLGRRSVTSSSNGTDFFLRVIRSNGSLNSICLWSVKPTVSYPNSTSAGIRPVITLQSGIQTSSGDGSEGSPYELVAM